VRHPGGRLQHKPAGLAAKRFAPAPLGIEAAAQAAAEAAQTITDRLRLVGD